MSGLLSLSLPKEIQQRFRGMRVLQLFRDVYCLITTFEVIDLLPIEINTIVEIVKEVIVFTTK